MIDAERWAEARRLRRVEELGISAIARRLGLSRKTVRRALEQETYPGLGPRKPPRRGSILDHLKPHIRRYLSEEPDLSAVQILRRLDRDHGFKGKISVVRRFVRTVREDHRQAYLTLTFLPGECAQVDWGHFGWTEVEGARRRVSLFAMVLAHSRLLYAELTLSERMDAFLEAHVRAFRYFGGLPKRLIYDNCKTVAVQRVGSEVRLNPRLVEFTVYHLCKVTVCPPRRPWHKGIVESGIGYVRKGFRRGRGKLEDLERARSELAVWLRETANARDHRTTRRKPAELFAEVERAALLPLPEQPYDTAHIEPSVSVNKFYRVHFDGNRYSVPFQLAYKRGLLLRATTAKVEVFHRDQQVAHHVRSFGRGVDVYDPEHDRGLRQRKRRDDRDLLLSRFVAVLGPQAEAYAAGLAKAHVRAAHHIRRVLVLVESFGAEEVRTALSHASRFGAFGADYVENVLHQERRRRVLGAAAPPPVVNDQGLAEVVVPEPDLSRLDHQIREGGSRVPEEDREEAIEAHAEGRRQKPTRPSGNQLELPWPEPSS